MDETYEDKEVLVIEQPEKELYSPEDSPQVEITEEMIQYSRDRTEGHIARVIALGEKLGFNFSQHDHTKFGSEIKEQYILIDNSFRKDLDPPVPYTKDMAEASFKHIKMEAHHPEYWDPMVMFNQNFGQNEPDTVKMEQLEDMPDNRAAGITDASEMSVPAICEMVCDWCAMSQEVGGHPAEWAQKNIGVRWNFTDEQEELIFLLIRMLWETPDAEEAELDAMQRQAKIMVENSTYGVWKPASEV